MNVSFAVKNFKHAPIAVLLAAFSTAAAGHDLPYPPPRFPDFPAVVTTEDLLEAARFFVNRKGGGPLPGYDIQPGEKALILVTPLYDQRIIDAMASAVREAGATADVFVGDVSDIIGSSTTGPRAWGYLENPMYLFISAGPKYLVRMQLGGGLMPNEVSRLVAWKNYDILINGSSTTDSGPDFRWEEIPWHRVDELLASTRFGMPSEVSQKLYELAWKQLKQARRVRVTDPEGTDIRWNLPADLAGIDEPPRFWREYMCMPDKLKGKDIQSEQTFREVDVTGVIVGTINHVGAFPRIEVFVRHSRIEKIEGGGRFGEEWRRILEKYAHTQWPGLPGPGFNWIEECATGVVPSAVRPRDAMYFPLGTFRERRRSGVLHWAFGAQMSPKDRAAIFDTKAPFDVREDSRDGVLPDGHFDVHNNFSTITLETADGETITFLDKGRLTVLDDPELRALAAQYGDPDLFLHEVWIPPVPGINVPGDYLEDYADDPVAWIANEYERFFAPNGAAHEGD